MDDPQEEGDRLDQVVRLVDQLVDQLVAMVAENNLVVTDLRQEVAANNHAIADLRTEVAANSHAIADLRSEVADLRSEVSGVEQRLTARIAGLDEHWKQSRALWEAESRHFAQAIGVLQRDVAVLKER